VTATITSPATSPGTSSIAVVQPGAAADAQVSGAPAWPPRARQTTWPATSLDRTSVWDWLSELPFDADGYEGRHPLRQRTGMRLLLDWLETHPGQTWQQRWLASGIEADPTWRATLTGWLTGQGHGMAWKQDVFFRALRIAIGVDLLRPSLQMLVSAGFRQGAMAIVMTRHRDPDGFARLKALCSADPDICAAVVTRTAYRSSLILAAKGGTLADVTAGDVLELLDAEAEVHRTKAGATHLFYRVMGVIGAFGDGAPATLRELRSRGQRTPEQMVDRYRLACQPIRDLLVEYLRERQPVLDYTSLESLAHYLVGLFWADLERHHPGIDSLHLPPQVAQGWKERLRTAPKTTRTPDGRSVQTRVPRINYRECLTPVRAFYLDLAHWAVEQPERWAAWVAPCPVGAEEIDRRKDKRHRKARMDARTRERLPVLPVLVRSVNQRRRDTAAVLEAARRAGPGETFTAAGQTLVRLVFPGSPATKVWAADPATSERRDLSREEDNAFWAFAGVEVLRATGIRVEELTELSHHSLIQYRLPTTGEVVPLLQIAPSKTDAERLLVISPDLADVLAAIVARVRGRDGTIPLLAAYDTHERTWSPPAPLLFQRRVRFEHRAISRESIRALLNTALEHTGLTDPVTGGPLRFTPHDFRRLFITDAILSGLPPHIAQVIAGHRDINVTIGYATIYPEQAIQAHLAFLARRRALRPSEEYRAPTDEEWTSFLGHFERRKVSTGTCGRAFATPCIHEHACIRCPMLWPDPAHRARLVEIRDNLIARIAEAQREGWLGEVEGLRVSLAGAEDKLTQIDHRPTAPTQVALGLPSQRLQP